jgi:hypothetical protein
MPEEESRINCQYNNQLPEEESRINGQYNNQLSEEESRINCQYNNRLPEKESRINYRNVVYIKYTSDNERCRRYSVPVKKGMWRGSKINTVIGNELRQ